MNFGCVFYGPFGISRNEWDQVICYHNMAHGDIEDLFRRTVSDKVICERVLEIPNNPQYYENQRGLASVVKKNF